MEADARNFVKDLLADEPADKAVTKRMDREDDASLSENETLKHPFVSSTDGDDLEEEDPEDSPTVRGSASLPTHSSVPEGSTGSTGSHPSPAVTKPDLNTPTAVKEEVPMMMPMDFVLVRQAKAEKAGKISLIRPKQLVSKTVMPLEDDAQAFDSKLPKSSNSPMRLSKTQENKPKLTGSKGFSDPDDQVPKTVGGGTFKSLQLLRKEEVIHSGSNESPVDVIGVAKKEKEQEQSGFWADTVSKFKWGREASSVTETGAGSSENMIRESIRTVLGAGVAQLSQGFLNNVLHPSSGTSNDDETTCSASSISVVRLDNPVGIKDGFEWHRILESEIADHVMAGISVGAFARIPEDALLNVDGRVSRPVISVPGADVGGFLIALAAVENTGRSELTYEMVESMLSNLLLTSAKARFTFPMDSTVLDRLCKSIRFCAPRDRLDNPPPHLLEALRVALVAPLNQGSTYFERLIRYPDADMYNVRRGLTESVIKAVFNLVWGTPQIINLGPEQIQIVRQKIRVSVVQGPKTDLAMLQIISSRCDIHHVPMLIPEIKGKSYAMNFVDAAPAYHRFLGEWLAEYSRHAQPTDTVRSYDPSRLATVMDDISRQHLLASLALDKGQTPLFSVIIPAICCRLD